MSKKKVKNPLNNKGYMTRCCRGGFIFPTTGRSGARDGDVQKCLINELVFRICIKRK